MGNELWCGQAQNGVNSDLNLTLKVKVNCPQNNRDLNQSLLHLWSKFGDPSLNGSQVIAWTSKWLTHRLTHTRGHKHTHTDTGNDNTRRPKLASGKNWSMWWPFCFSEHVDIIQQKYYPNSNFFNSLWPGDTTWQLTKDTPYLILMGAMGCLLWISWRKWLSAIETVLSTCIWALHYIHAILIFANWSISS